MKKTSHEAHVAHELLNRMNQKSFWDGVIIETQNFEKMVMSRLITEAGDGGLIEEAFEFSQKIMPLFERILEVKKYANDQSEKIGEEIERKTALDQMEKDLIDYYTGKGKQNGTILTTNVGNYRRPVARKGQKGEKAKELYEFDKGVILNAVAKGLNNIGDIYKDIKSTGIPYGSLAGRLSRLTKEGFLVRVKHEKGDKPLYTFSLPVQK